MSKKDKSQRPTELVCILDRSGSMDHIRSDAEGGFNTFIDKQRALKDVGPCYVTLHQFDTQHHVVWERQLLTAETPQPYHLEPRGMTALNDAIGMAITAMGEIPKKTNVIVVIVTDGMENASGEYTRPQVRQLITDREAKGWSFVFLGAGIDAFAEGQSYGISETTTLRGGATAQGFETSYAVMDHAVSGTRRHGTKAVINVDDQRKAAATDVNPNNAGAKDSADADA